MTRGTDVTDAKRMYHNRNEGDFPDELTIELQKEGDLRYGENPNQPAAVYRFKGVPLAEYTNIRMAKSGKGGLSATNLGDVTRALEILKFFDTPSAAVMKHNIPSGFATQYEDEPLAFTYEQARDADARSAFGSAVVVNRPIDIETAQEITSSYVEVIAAPEYEEGVMKILEKKEKLRVVLYDNLNKLPKFMGDDTQGLYDLKVMPSGRVVVQKPYLSSIRSREDLVLDAMIKKEVKGEGRTYLVKRDPTESELRDMFTAWYVNLGVRSNGIVIVKDGVTLAVGSGQQERVGAIEQAIAKAYMKAMDREKIQYNPRNWCVSINALEDAKPLTNAVASSDGFCLRDNVKPLADEGITALIQPGGGQSDHRVIKKINENDMAMALTKERCFGHF